jgi:hypothetical protein
MYEEVAARNCRRQTGAPATVIPAPRFLAEFLETQARHETQTWLASSLGPARRLGQGRCATDMEEVVPASKWVRCVGGDACTARSAEVMESRDTRYNWRRVLSELGNERLAWQHLAIRTL